MNWFTALFSKAVRAFKEFLKIAFPIALQIFIGLLKDIAISIVTKLETTDLSSDAKRAEAFKQISIEARTKGLQFKDSWINLLIEIAVAVVKQMKAKNG
jgi:hypothetical protein